MSNELNYDAAPSLTLYACRTQLNGNVLLSDGLSDEVWGTSGHDADDYDIPVPEKPVGVSGHYVGDFDALGNVAAGLYRVAVYKQAGGSPADSDKVIARGQIRWSAAGEITDVEQALEVDTIAEPAAGAPPASPTMVQILNYIYRLFRNKKATDAGPPAKLTVYKDDGSTPMFEASLSDDGTIFTKGEFEAP